jgi:hypothetical protein
MRKKLSIEKKVVMCHLSPCLLNYWAHTGAVFAPTDILAGSYNFHKNIAVYSISSLNW